MGRRTAEPNRRHLSSSTARPGRRALVPGLIVVLGGTVLGLVAWHGPELLAQFYLSRLESEPGLIEEYLAEDASISQKRAARRFRETESGFLAWWSTRVNVAEGSTLLTTSLAELEEFAEVQTIPLIAAGLARTAEEADTVFGAWSPQLDALQTEYKAFVVELRELLGALLEREPDKARAVLLEALIDPETSTDEASWMLLLLPPDPNSVDLLAAIARMPSVAALELVFEKLAQLGEPAIGPLLKMLEEDPAAQRAHAAGALGKLCERDDFTLDLSTRPAIVEVLSKAVEDQNPVVQEQAVIALAALTEATPDAKILLRAIAADPHHVNNVPALYALGSMDLLEE